MPRNDQPTPFGPIKLAAIGAMVVALCVAAVWLLWSSPPSAPQRASPATAPALADAPEPTVLATAYTLNLSGAGRPAAFSGGTIKTTRKGARPMLGPFGAEGVRFTWPDLTPHQAVHLVIDLGLIDSWNGSSTIWGPDIWFCGETSGRSLLRATFCNAGFFSNNNEQTYPDQFPSPDDATPHPGWTAASERQTLGIIRKFTNADPVVTEDCSSVYHLDWTFPHTASVLSLKFGTQCTTKKMKFEFLGFHAETVAELPKLNGDEIATAWADMSGEDPIKADRAVWRLASAGPPVLPFVRARMAEPSPAGASPYLPGRIEHVLQLLGETPATRPTTPAPVTAAGAVRHPVAIESSVVWTPSAGLAISAGSRTLMSFRTPAAR